MATLAHLADGAEIVTVIEGENPPIRLDDLDLGLETASSSRSTAAGSRTGAG